jgi:CubicO group peptidase (beta-lactamase class C family)
MEYAESKPFAAFLMAFIVVATGSASAQDAATNPRLVTEIDRVVSPYVEAGDFMGVVAVQYDGGDPVVRHYGLASLELGVPHEAADIFLIGSISKQFTAAAILLLEQDGRLKTTDPVSLHLPEFKPAAPITIEQLLTHTSGVADVYSLKRYSATRGQGGTFEDVVADLGATELTHQPGSVYAYSNGGYSVLAAVIEQASGLAYGDYLRDRIFRPLGMSSSAHDEPGPFVMYRVSGYDPWGKSGWTHVLPPAEAYTRGSGSIWSSAEDLLAWNSALHGGRVLADSSYQKLVRDYGYQYGYGVSVFQRFGRDVIGHDGRVTGFSSDAARYLDERLTVVILSNVQSVARDRIRRSVAAVTLGEAISERQPPALADRASVAALAELEGVYSFGPRFEVSIREENGRLLARANEGSDSELVPTEDGDWFSRVLYATVRFERDEEGQVDRLVWGAGEQAPVGHRSR